MDYSVHEFIMQAGQHLFVLFSGSGSEAEGVGEEVKKSGTIAVARREMLKK
jgi:hypothetical protein